jgi:hypothetical protein
MFLFLISLFTFCTPSQAPLAGDSVLAYVRIYQGDTIPMGFLPQVNIWSAVKWKSDADRLEYLRLKRNLVIVYPYAVKAARLLLEMNEELSHIEGNLARKRYIKSKERVLKENFEDRLKGMSTYQGRLLMLLIDRQTGQTCYELVKEFRGGFLAWTYHTMMNVYDEDLNMKRTYDATQYPLIDHVLWEIETGKLKVSEIK